jgi:hypothetical protein
MINMENRKEEEQKALVESLSKPAEMLEDLKGQWQNMMSSQTDKMKEIVQHSLNEAISKRKESLEKRKGKDGSSDGAGSQNSKFYDKKIEYFENEFKEHVAQMQAIEKERETERAVKRQLETEKARLE